jgi:hypothetical protein
MPSKPRQPRERNPLLDAIVAATGGNPAETTPSAWSLAAKALSEIKAVSPDVTVDEIRSRAENQRQTCSWTLTPMSLAKYWGNLASKSPSDESGLSVHSGTPSDATAGQARFTALRSEMLLREALRDVAYARANPDSVKFVGIDRVTDQMRAEFDDAAKRYETFYAKVQAVRAAAGNGDMSEFSLDAAYAKQRETLSPEA